MGGTGLQSLWGKRPKFSASCPGTFSFRRPTSHFSVDDFPLMEYNTGIDCAMHASLLLPARVSLKHASSSPLPSTLRKEDVERESEPNKLGLKHPRLAYWKTSLEKVRAVLKPMRQGCNRCTEKNLLQSQLKLWWYPLRASRCMHAVSLDLLNELRYDLVICMTLTGRDWWISSGHTCVSPSLDTCPAQYTNIPLYEWMQYYHYALRSSEGPLMLQC